MYETNSKGVPIGYSFGLGEMAAVCGYGKIVDPATGAIKTRTGLTKWVEPHGRAFANGVQVSWGVKAFIRPDAKTPNFSLGIFARKIDAGMPIIS